MEQSVKAQFEKLFLITYEAHVVGTSQSVPGALGFDPSFGGISCRIFRQFIARVALFRQ